MSFPYRQVFAEAERTLLEYGSKNVPLDEIRQRLNHFKTFENRTLSDDDFYAILVAVVFYGGFKAAIVTAKMPVIRGHFPNFRTVAAYAEKDIDRVLNDDKMIRHRRKVKACCNNAKQIATVVQDFGSFQAYIDSFEPKESLDNLTRLKSDLQQRFDYLGGITVYHFMTDIGLPVLKPDRVLRRVLFRLGATNTEDDDLETINQGRKFAEATGLPIRYIDIVFVALGQAQSLELGVDRGICLKEPRCNVCGLTECCRYFQQNRAGKGPT